MTVTALRPVTQTILIADDDPLVRAIAMTLLEGKGYQVLEAADGAEALDIIRGHRVDLVVLDMLMPNKDGLETILELRRNRSTIRILAISSGGSMDVGSLLRPAIAFGADRSMAKPLRPAAFTSTVADMLAGPAGMEAPVARL